MRRLTSPFIVAVAVLAFQQVGWGQQQTQLQWDTVIATRDAYYTWSNVKVYVPDSGYKNRVTDFTCRAFYRAVYTYYGYNTRPGGGNPMSEYDRMWAWAQVERDAEQAFLWMKAGLETWVPGSYTDTWIPWASHNLYAKNLMCQAMLAAEASADEAFDAWYYSFSW